jgi:hypothetical protein
MNAEILEAPDLLPFQQFYRLPESVSAIQCLPSESGEHDRLGLLNQLPAGAEIQVGGPGFNDETLRIWCEGSSYFVFLEDLKLARKQAAMAGAF